MEILGKAEIWSFSPTVTGALSLSNSTIRKNDGVKVKNFRDLAKKIAEIQYRNRDFHLLYRGQASDYKNASGFTTIKPTIFRPPSGPRGKLLRGTLRSRFDILRKAEILLADGYQGDSVVGRQRIQRQRLLRWAILQHYQVCDTPVLDVTHSLRIAASFAAIDVQGMSQVMVLAVPNLSGAVTANAAAGLQVVRLLSVCPPSAMRPHLQEGYSLSEYPDVDTSSQSKLYAYKELDFGRRLVGKFCFDPTNFFDADFPAIGKAALYSDAHDWLESLTSQIKNDMKD